MNWLNYDSPLSQAIRRIGNLILLNLCYFVCCLPIFTIGASTTALYAACICDPDTTWPVAHFFRSIRTNFRQATVIWLIMLVPIALLCICFYLTGVLRIPGYQLIQLLLLVLALILGSSASFVFPLQARYENSIRQTLRNSLVFGLCAPIPGVFMLALWLLPIIVFFISVNIFIYLCSFWMIIGFSGAALINSRICLSIFAKVPTNN